MEKLSDSENYNHLVELSNIPSNEITNNHVNEFADMYIDFVTENRELFEKVEYLLGSDGIGRVTQFRKMKTIKPFYQMKVGNHFSQCIWDLDRYLCTREE